MLLGLEPRGSSSWKGRESFLQNTEPGHECLPPVRSGVGGSGVPGSQRTEEHKYFSQTWLVVVLAPAGEQPSAQVPAQEIICF